ncbi:hypothetical protein M406DRAFT_328931 [Cryphonectria parasitica EP155]|uniref:Uncharacterized protein n=1 Tax=Cryphonectria parasitica (strain ATCC 38755 / EP155) TaxID=660469 RepID=A0A9P4Y7I8_CRYP1|nr:uncharacterized protein M406DRAFT_328931 [Cryphonectria parasitica EP155]KAF3767879.1 hypothetical protein M406DRAFT_328931 [Cryphonectria parasitica EP155]
MLRGRRLPVSQSPLPRWRTTATTDSARTRTALVVAAVHYSSSSPSTSPTATPPLLTDGYGTDHSALTQALEEQVPAWEQEGMPQVDEARQEMHSLAGEQRKFRTYTPAGKDYSHHGDSSKNRVHHITHHRHSGPVSLPPVEKSFPTHLDLNDEAPIWRKIRAPDKNIPLTDLHARVFFRKSTPIHENLRKAGRKPFQDVGAVANAQNGSEETQRDTAVQVKPYIRPEASSVHHSAVENRAEKSLRQPSLDNPSSTSSRRTAFQRRGGHDKKPSPLLDAQLRAVADRLGIEVSRKATDVKRATARRLGFKSWDQAPAAPQVANTTPTQSATTPRAVNLAKGASDPTGSGLPKAQHTHRSAEEPALSRPAAPPRSDHPHEKTILSAYSPTTFKPQKTQKDINFAMRRNWLPVEGSPMNTDSPSEQSQHLSSGDNRLLLHAGDSDFGLDERRRSSFGVPSESEQTSLDKESELNTSSDTVRSIFKMLFPEESEHTSRSLRSVLTNRRGRPSEMGSDVDPRAKYFIDISAKPRQAYGSIYKQLFPGQLPPDPEATVEKDEPHESSAYPQQDTSDGPLLISLRNEVRNWIPEEDREHITAPEAGKYGSHSTVVVISGVSNSLVDTDFYRVIPEGKYVEGWAGGLVKVVQARDPLTYEPVGQYFLMFHSRAPAVAYVQEAKRLYELSRRLLHSATQSGRTPARGPLDTAPVNPQPFLTDEERAAVQSFTICPPAAPLRISVRMWTTQMVGQIASKTTIADVVQALRPEAEMPAKVLISINGGGRASGGGLTPAELWSTLRDDGRERGTPWALINLREGIRPVRVKAVTEGQEIKVMTETVDAPLQAEDDDDAGVVGGPPAETTSVVGTDGLLLPSSSSQDAEGPSDKESHDDGDGDDDAGQKDERFHRFVLTFKQRAIARRFVRCWHKRPIYDAELGQTVLVNAVALM